MSLLDRLIKSLQILPGVGPKSSQRMAFYLLQKNRQGAQNLAESLVAALEKVRECERCRALTESSLCDICANPKRNSANLCVVESPADILLIEQATAFNGHYFVLHGKLSPIDGVGPTQLQFSKLVQRLSEDAVKEMIIATGSTVEGETTAQYLSQLASKAGIPATRLAHGVPLGGDIEFIDSGTLAHAFGSRTRMESS